tara:strand:- start:294 stop:467 length:174 start_codon:yes stop_codon:yes gene_type:complete
MKKKIKIPMAAVKEIKRLQWQIEQAFFDLEKSGEVIEELEIENEMLRQKLEMYNVPN